MGSFGSEPQQAVVSWCLPERNVFGGWYRQQDPGREKYCKSFSVREDQSLSTPVRLHRVKAKNGLFGGETTASSRIMALFIDSETVHACYILYVCVVGFAEDLEARALKSSPQTKAPGNARRAKARPTQDGRRGLRRQRGRGGGCGANRFRRKTRGVLII